MEDEIEGPSHLLVLYVVTSGLQGDSLGTDQKEITWLSYTIIDVRENKEIARRQYVVKPSYMEKDFFFVNKEERADAAENRISKAALAHAPTLTDQVIREKGISLLEAIRDLENWVSSLWYSIEVIVDGQAPIRQCLCPVSTKKFGGLWPRHRYFFDLRKKFSACYSKGLKRPVVSIKEMMQHVNLPPNWQLPDDCYVGEALNMVSLVKRMISDGHTFSVPEKVDPHPYPNLRVTDDCVARVRGLGWPLQLREVREFFAGLIIIQDGIVIRMTGQSKRVGEALVCFESKEHRDMALKRHNQFVGQLLVEVHEASIHEYEALERCQFLVLMTGLPSLYCADKVVQFFASGDKPCKVVDGRDGMLFLRCWPLFYNEAIVSFADEEEAQKALSKHMACIDKCKIQLSRVTLNSAQRSLNVSFLTRSEVSSFFISPPTNEMTTSTMSNKWVHLQYLPCEAPVKDILQFLGEHVCKNIAKNGIHMMYSTRTGKPIGEAFIKMTHEDRAAECVAQCRSRSRPMNLGVELRQVEQGNWLQMQRKFTFMNDSYYHKFIKPRIEQYDETASETVGTIKNTMPDMMPTNWYGKWVYLHNIPREASVENVLQYIGKESCKEMVTNSIYMVCSDDVPTVGTFIEMTDEYAAGRCTSKCDCNLMKIGDKLYFDIRAQQCCSHLVTKRIVDLRELDAKLGPGTTKCDESLPIMIQGIRIADRT